MDRQTVRPYVDPADAPYEPLKTTSFDGKEAVAVVRRPPGGEPPCPVLVYLHGGLSQRDVEQLKAAGDINPTLHRFLAAGYVTVAATFRSREADMQDPAALQDCLAILEAVRKRDDIDPASIVVWGDSGGGSLALELAGETEICAAAVQEPATVLLTGLFTGSGSEGREANHQKMMSPEEHYEQVREHTRAKLERIRCPLFFAGGGRHPLNRLNHEFIIPELLDLGKNVEAVLYPGQPHGFSNGRGNPAMTKKFFNDVHAFFLKYLPTPPKPVEDTFVGTRDVAEDLRIRRQGRPAQGGPGGGPRGTGPGRPGPGSRPRSPEAAARRLAQGDAAGDQG